MSLANSNQELVLEVADRFRSVFGSTPDSVALHEPDFDGREAELLIDCLNSGYVSSVGRYVTEFETELARVCGVKYAVAVVNGTAALELALHVANVGADSEVLMPSFTFVATANAARHLGAIPHFVDIDPDNMGLNPDALRGHLESIVDSKRGVALNRRSGRRIAAIVPMHTFGHPVDFDRLQAVAEEFDIPIIEDAAESLGSKYFEKPCGSLGMVGAVSFNGNKIITTGGGGAVLTNQESLAQKAKHLSTTAKLPHRWEFIHDQVAYNYRMPNLNAALGLAQLERLEHRIREKRALATFYLDTFKSIDGITIFKEAKGVRSNYWLNAMILDQEVANARDPILTMLNDSGILARPSWKPLHTLAMYRECPRAELPVTNDLHSRLINIPSSASLRAKLIPKTENDRRY